jgi:hypothetical protein
MTYGSIKRRWMHKPTGRIVECHTHPALNDWDVKNWVLVP